MKNTQKNELAVCGYAAVKKLAEKNPDKIKRFYFTQERMGEFGDLCKILASKKRPYNKVSEDELLKICGSVHHQGVVAMIEQPEIEPLNSAITDEWLHKKESALLLDRVGNANNLGAIVRSAAFFGCKNIIIPLDEAQSSITTSSYRVAQGGMEFVEFFSVKSIPNLLKALKGKMVRIGTEVNTKKTVDCIKNLTGKKPVLIVLGNEEHGISKEVKENCDELITIPFGAGFPTEEVQAIESLNVAQAAAIILYEMRK
ncbi:TrmH family RNA methyltransferase [Treponema pectinovorum]|uniref:TrmH family RNA methyltransferase n=1 Tax=Treponema pectinovorum TaxID=164 RepID=UPI0011F3CD7F|nr:RNA methyltransferase [Treponema pectinovorum]